MAELGLGTTELARVSGFSDQLITELRKGIPPGRAPTRAKVCRALQWPADSIDRILRGESPVEDEPGNDDLADRITVLEGHQAALEQRFVEHQHRVEQQLEALHKAVKREP